MEFFRDKRVVIILSMLAAAGGAVAVLSYIDNRKSKALSDKILHLDKEIKELDLVHKKQRNLQSGLSS